jgi:hypothetical protein
MMHVMKAKLQCHGVVRRGRRRHVTRLTCTSRVADRLAWVPVAQLATKTLQCQTAIQALASGKMRENTNNEDGTQARACIAWSARMSAPLKSSTIPHKQLHTYYACCTLFHQFVKVAVRAAITDMKTRAASSRMEVGMGKSTADWPTSRDSAKSVHDAKEMSRMHPNLRKNTSLRRAKVMSGKARAR